MKLVVLKIAADDKLVTRYYGRLHVRNFNTAGHLQVAHVGGYIFFLDIIWQSAIVVLVYLDLVDVVDEDELIAAAVDRYDVSLQRSICLD